MPYMIDDNNCVVKKSTGKKMGCHPSHAEAEKQLAALYANESSMSLIQWIDPFQYTSGQPFRVFPIGTFKRGDRTIDLTPERLQEMKANYDAQRPRWKIPIYAGHPTETNPDPPKFGNVASLELRSDGLYAVPEYTDDGQKLINSQAYQYISPGVLWGIGGSKYVDEQGVEYDNTLDHISLTNRPFFGSKTAMFSSYEDLADYSEIFKDYNTEQRKELAAKGHAMADGSYPIADAADLSNAIHAIGRGSGSHAAIKAHIIKRAKAMGKTDMLPEDWKVNMSADMTTEEMVKKMEAEGMSPEDIKKKLAMMKGKTNMAEDTIVTPVAPVVPAVSVEEFNALKSKAEAFDSTIKKQAEEFDAKLKAEKERADTFATQFAAERKARAIETLGVKATKLAWLPIKPDEYAEKFYALGEINAELAKWFAEKFDAVEKLLAQSALFGQVSHDNAPSGEETIETLADKIVAEKFSGDMTKYKDALIEAGKSRPNLAKAGLMSR